MYRKDLGVLGFQHVRVKGLGLRACGSSVFRIKATWVFGGYIRTCICKACICLCVLQRAANATLLAGF